MSVGYYYPKLEWISRDKWNETKAIIRQYPELLEEYKNIAEGEAIQVDGQPKGNKIGDPTANRAIKAERIGEKIRAIEEAQNSIEPEYVKGVMDYLIKRKLFPNDADERTYYRKVKVYIHAVAYLLHII